MARSLDEYVRTSKKLATPESRRAPRRLRAGVTLTDREAHTVASQVIALRQKHGFTQKELAARSGRAQSEISRIERGSIHPTEPTLVKLADALGADLRLIERSTGSAGAWCH
jgi:ribosome-binding protein aMBF1 (putative translation factor)